MLETAGARNANAHARERGNAGGPGDVVCGDLGQGSLFAFRPGVFDGAISVSAIQWLCFATKDGHDPMVRTLRFFRSLRRVLRVGAAAVLQFYPEQLEHMDTLRTAALRCGFTGALVVDYPEAHKAKKFFFVLTAAGTVNSSTNSTSGRSYANSSSIKGSLADELIASSTNDSSEGQSAYARARSSGFAGMADARQNSNRGKKKGKRKKTPNERHADAVQKLVQSGANREASMLKRAYAEQRMDKHNKRSRNNKKNTNKQMQKHPAKKARGSKKWARESKSRAQQK